MIRTLVLNAWFYGFVGLGAGVLLGRAGRWLLRRRAEQTRPPEPPREVVVDAVAWRDVGLVIVTGVGFAVLWLRYGSSTQTVITSAYFSTLALIFALDISHRWVPNALLLPAAIFALAISVLTDHPPLTGALLGGTVGFVWFYLVAIAYRGALGAGDIKLAGLIGLMTGFPNVLVALAIGILIGGIVAALLLISGKKTHKSYIPYAPFLVTGALVTLAFETQISTRFASFL